MKKFLPIGLIILMVFGLTACTFDNIKPVSEMTPKEKAAFFLSMYNAQDMNYRAMAAMPNLTEPQKEMMREKKLVLSQVYPLISVYVSYVEQGAVPSPETERLIVENLDRAAAMVVNQ